MTVVLNRNQIQDALKKIDPVSEIIPTIAEGFIAYSRGQVVVPPVGELIFEEGRGDCHIKYGYIKNDDYFVIKVAAGFYDNPKVGLPTTFGLMLLFSQKTGELISVLLDEGYLTQVRTAAAGAMVGKYFAPRKVQRVGIFGAGVQARMQLEYLRYVREFEDVIVWGISQEELDKYKSDMESKGFRLKTTREAEEVASTANVIVTATPSHSPLLRVWQIRRAMHITAMGSDTAEKQELDPAILKLADRVVVDSIPQSLLRGEVFKALAAGIIRKEDLVELGTALSDPKLQRQSDDDITVVDLTGVAVQDIQITKVVWKAARPTAA